MNQPFFIAGTGRTGSSYLYSLLRVHPKVAITNEANIFACLQSAYWHTLTPVGEVGKSGQGTIVKEYIPLFSEIFINQSRKMIEEFYSSFFAHKDFTHWGDKLPAHHSVPYIKSLYPEAIYLLLVRDPRDTICSYRSYGHTLKQRPNYLDFTFEEFCTGWVHVYQQLLEMLESYHLIRYEQLVKTPEQTLKNIFTFIGLESHPACIKAIKTNDTFTGHGTSPSPQTSIERWRNELTKEEASTCHEICGTLMQKFGYQ